MLKLGHSQRTAVPLHLDFNDSHPYFHFRGSTNNTGTGDNSHIPGATQSVTPKE
ncbi:hypothetical protein M407DRAFT_245706 [Tulasnella calospora MUT 4182]|uniref:Uncharacterized protein n=1 Tax=Tulasnella calospora MUT 4182 TaxID=1051891 RepID=A0A0C3Q9M9_9AGAM|nr:hypothetical protein M407DRAFT_245706 [Tulasnella calospora MUT 4182]